MPFYLALFVYVVIFTLILVHDVLSYSGNTLILNIMITVVFWFIIISSLIESYCKNEVEKAKTKENKK